MAEHYGLTVNRNGMCRCPFHDDHTPSMKLNTDYYYCFGCLANGDVITFTSKLLGLKPYEAAQRLAADFGLDSRQPSQTSYIPHKQSHYAQQREVESRCYSSLVAYLHLLARWKVEHAPLSEEEPLDERFVEACQMLEHIEYLVNLITLGEPEERKLVVEQLEKDGLIDWLQDYLRRLEEKGECAYDTRYETA